MATSMRTKSEAVAQSHVVFLTLTESVSTDMRGMAMADSEESVAVYRLNAANCVEMAKESSESDQKLTLLGMAQAWLRLADLT
jgi:hypothetical protein